MAAWKINGAGDHAVTGTKTIFYFAARPDLSKNPPGRDWAGDGPLLDEWPLSIELQCRTRWQELLQHELRVLREEGLVMDLHWDTSVGETLVYGGVIGPITVQKEFKTRVFILVSLRAASPAQGRRQGQSYAWMAIKRESSAGCITRAAHRWTAKIKRPVDLWCDYCAVRTVGGTLTLW